MQFKTANTYLEIDEDGQLASGVGQLDAAFLNAFWDHLKAECAPEIGDDGLEYFSLADLRWAENAAKEWLAA